MKFTLTELLDEQACYEWSILQPQGLHYPQGHVLPEEQAPTTTNAHHTGKKGHDMTQVGIRRDSVRSFIDYTEIEVFIRLLGGKSMVLELPPRSPAAQALNITWETLPADFVLPDDPVENIQQPLLADALTDALGEAERIIPHMLIASNFGLVATVNQKTVVKAPDWLYVLRVVPVPEGTIRRSYTPNAEGDAVAVVMEFLSETDTGEYSIRPTYPYGKFYFYERILRVPAYVIFDPHSLTLELHRLEGDRYVLQEPTAEGRYWILELELFLGVWYGTRLGSTIHWLRWWDRDGNLLPWSFERAEQERQRAEQERQRAEALAAKLRELGLDPENL